MTKDEIKKEKYECMIEWMENNSNTSLCDFYNRIEMSYE